MAAWRRRLESLGEVAAFDYPYMLAGKKRPDPQPRLIQAHRDALADARAGHDGHVVLIGKSMGSRIGCHVSLEDAVDGLVCLGYPLKGMGKAGKIRDEVLLALRTPVLFVQGTRDNLAPLDLFEEVLAKMTARYELMIVEAGNHSLDVTKTQLKAAAETQDDVDRRVLTKIGEFVGSL